MSSQESHLPDDRWCGKIRVGKDRVLNGLEFGTAGPDGGRFNGSITGDTLDFLAIINPNDAPIHMDVQHLQVTCKDAATVSWLLAAIDPRSEPADAEPPSAEVDQTGKGILCQVSSFERPRPGQGPPVNQILIFGTRCAMMEDGDGDRDGFPGGIGLDEYEVSEEWGPMALYAACLSTSLAYKGSEQDTREGLPDVRTGDQKVEPLVMSRQDESQNRLTKLFDDAAERRKRPRLANGRERSESRASSLLTSPMLPQDGFSLDALSPAPLPAPAKTTAGTQLNRRTSGTGTPTTSSPTGEPRPVSRRGNLERTSTLLSQSYTADTALEQQIEARNKEVISKLVLAGMKTYGLTSYKSSNKSRGRSSLGGGDDSQLTESPAPTLDGESQDIGSEARDAEYKNVYHQTVKGTTFTFRKAMGSMMLRQESVKEVVDRLLAMFCSEPT